MDNFETYISNNSILSLEGKPFGYKCGPSPNSAGNPECFHNNADPLNDDYYLKTSFITYSANGVPETKIHRAEWDFADDDPRNYVKDRNYYFNETEATDFAIGYQSTLLDALSPPAGNQDGDRISGFEEYVASSGDHQNRAARTVIGVSCDGQKLFLSIVISKYAPVVPSTSTSTAKWVRDLQKQGACRVIMLDGGGSTEFRGQWENDKEVGFYMWDYPPCDSGVIPKPLCPEVTINAIVAYNDSINLIETQAISPEGGVFSPSSQVTINFVANTFDSTVEVTYAPSVRTDIEGLFDVGVIYRLKANSQMNNVKSNKLDNIQPNKPYQVVLHYTQDNVPFNADESKLTLYFWNGIDWEIEPTSVVDPANNTVTAHPERFGKWALLTNAIYYNYLPIIQK